MANIKYIYISNYIDNIYTSKAMIEHEGIIHSINGNQFTILISQNSACSECHAKGACMAADTKEKMVDVVDDSGMFRLNERVMLLGKT